MKLLSPDELSDDQRSVLDSYRTSLPEGVVCVNVVLGAESWDVRPLILRGKQVCICRTSQELPEAQCKALAAELQGFSVIRSCPGEVLRASGAKRFFLIRPYVTSTLSDQMDSGEIQSGQHNQWLVEKLFALLREMQSCSLIHGHICPSNLAMTNGSLVLLDPLMGAINNTQGSLLAPELSPGQEVPWSADLFGLGVTLQALLGGSMSAEQEQITRRLLLPSARQRPSLEQAQEAFLVAGGPSMPSQKRSDRVIKRISEDATKSGGSTGDRKPKVPSSRGPLSTMLWLAAACGFAALSIKVFFPEIYANVSSRLSLFESQVDPTLAADWSSGDRARMTAVARRAILNQDEAAAAVIVDSIMAGGNPPNTTPRLMRVALNDLWRNELTANDVGAVLRLTVAPLFKEGLDSVPPLASLHPGVILAVAGEMPPNDPAPQLKLLPLSTFSKLPDPFGAAFKQLGDLGVSSAGAPESVALAAITSGMASSRAFDAFMGSDASPKTAIARLTILMPIVSGNDAATAQLVASIRDRGGDLGQVLGWFDIEDLAKWSGLTGTQKLTLVLNRLPEGELSQPQYADLMTFPLPGVREQAAVELKKRFFRETDGNLLLTLSGPGNRLTREQTIALVSALSLPPAKRTPFVAAWFGLKPAPDTVLLILLARSGYDSSDTFNLEAARYLRRTQWSATTEMLQLLAQHPEPLARTLAYAKLDPKIDGQKKILQERISAEKDKGLLKMVMGKLSAELPPSSPSTPAAPKAP